MCVTCGIFSDAKMIFKFSVRYYFIFTKIKMIISIPKCIVSNRPAECISFLIMFSCTLYWLSKKKTTKDGTWILSINTYMCVCVCVYLSCYLHPLNCFEEWHTVVSCWQKQYGTCSMSVTAHIHHHLPHSSHTVCSWLYHWHTNLRRRWRTDLFLVWIKNNFLV